MLNTKLKVWLKYVKITLNRLEITHFFHPLLYLL